MIVRNEEKLLPDCLDSLKSLRESVDCTLVITDTGSIDETKTIAKERADKFIEYTWDGDFSKARNTVFEGIDSEWFMYIDADEVLPEDDTLVEFFTSGEYKNYDSASLYIHSILADKHEFLSNSIRLVKHSENTRFERIIRETLVSECKNCKSLNVMLSHSGFSQKLLRAKELRNVTLYRNAIESDSDNNDKALDQLYLGDCIYKYDDYETKVAWDESLKAATSDDADPYLKYLVFVRKMQYQYDNSDYAAVAPLHDEYMKYRSAETKLDAIIYADLEEAFLAGVSAGCEKDYDTAIAMIKRYEECLKIFKDNREFYDRHLRLYPAINWTKAAEETADKMISVCCMTPGQFDFALSHFLKSPTLNSNILVCMEALPDFSELERYMKLPESKEIIMDYFPKSLQRERLADILRKIEGPDSDYAILYRYFTEPIDPNNETLHTKKVIIEYLIKYKKDLEDLDYLTKDYIYHVYNTDDSIHYSDMIREAQKVLAEKIDN
jgi:glycosyltransferase involved in cell wall biosynthesis